MKYNEIINETIHLPISRDLYDLIDDCRKFAKTPDELRAVLTKRLQAYIEPKINAIRREGDRNTKPVVLVMPLSDNAPVAAAGMFRAFDYDDGVDAEKYGLPSIEDGTMQIILFATQNALYTMLDPTLWSHDDIVRRFGSTFKHEVVHAIQYLRSKKFQPKATYTIGNKRIKKDGTKYGKRGDTEYIDHKPANYYGTDLEIDAHAASAAAEIIHRSRKEPQDQQRYYIEKIMRNLQDMSSALMMYRDLFKKSSLGFLFDKPDPKRLGQTKRQKVLVWNKFRLKLAKYLMQYLEKDI